MVGLLGLLKVGLLFGAVVLAGFSILSVMGTRKVVARAKLAEGTILGITRAPGSLWGSSRVSNWRYYLHINFESDGGEASHFKSTPVYNQGAYRVGSTVEVLYDPARVGEPRLASFWGIWGRSVDIASYSLNLLAAWLVVSLAGGFVFAV